MSQPAENDELQALREQLRILELENNRLAERAEETLLLGLISEKVRASDDPRELIESGLEQIAVLRNLAFAACCHQDHNRFRILQSFCSRTAADLKGQYLSFPPETIGPLLADSYLLDAGDSGRVELAPDIAAVLRPTAIALFPMTSGQGRDYNFIFADDRPDLDFGDMRYLLRHALEIMISRIDNLDLLDKLTALNLDLDMKICDRTRDLVTANDSLQRGLEERQSAELALRASENRFRTLADNAFDPIFVLDEALRIVDVNGIACSVLGYERGQLLGKDLIGILKRESDDSDHPDFELPDEGSVFTQAETLRCRDGSLLPVETRMAIIRLDGRRHVIVQTRDVSQQTALEEQLLQSLKMEAVGRLAGGIAHDFNNILMTIIGHVDLALMDLPDNHPVRPDIKTIGQAGERASRLTRQLLAFSRREIMSMAPLDLNENIRELATMLRRVIGEDIELVLELDQDCGNIKADPGKIEQILMNLVINARDAMPGGGKLTIRTHLNRPSPALAAQTVQETDHSGNRIVLSLIDTGTGIPPEILDNIFDPFFSTKDSDKGTGLGLSTVYGLVQQHEAQISVDSLPGRGARFDIDFPEILAGVDVHPAPSTLPAPGGQETILLVEDNAPIREVFATMLTKLGYHLLIARDGIEALELVEKHDQPIDLALTDVIMPRMNGKLLAERLGRMRPETKIVFMSGYTDDMIGKHGILEKGTHFIQKPISYQKLAIRIRDVLDA